MDAPRVNKTSEFLPPVLRFHMSGCNRSGHKSLLTRKACISDQWPNYWLALMAYHTQAKRVASEDASWKRICNLTASSVSNVSPGAVQFGRQHTKPPWTRLISEGSSSFLRSMRRCDGVAVAEMTLESGKVSIKVPSSWLLSCSSASSPL